MYQAREGNVVTSPLPAWMKGITKMRNRPRDIKGQFITMDPIRRFWSHVDKSGPCWLWMGQRYQGRWNYGKVRWHGKMVNAQRVSWELRNGPVPDGMYILHRCDNPPCVR